MEEVKTELSLFEQALAKRDEQEKTKEEAKNNQNFGDYEETQTVGLVDKKEIVGRVLGAPLEMRNKETDPKLILQSKVVKEDKKGYAQINWKFIEKGGKYVPDPEWILTRFYNKVNEGKWEKYADGHTDERGKDGAWTKYHSGTQISKLIEGNAKDGEKYPKSFYPSKRVVLNWIDRHDTWCQDNNHCKLLSAKKSPFDILNDDGTKNTIYFTDTGIPLSVYSAIMEHCRAVHTLDIDLIIIKKAIEKKYEVWDVTDEKYISKSSVEIGTSDPLSDAERDYELYNLDKLYKVCSYRKMKKVMESRFALCDSELGTSFKDELLQLVKEEEEFNKLNTVYWIDKHLNIYQVSTRDEYELLRKTEPFHEEVSYEDFKTFKIKVDSLNGSDPVVEEIPEHVDESKEAEQGSKPEELKEPKEKEVATQSRRSASIEESVEASLIKDICEKVFPSWNKLKEEEKSIMVKSINAFEGDTPIYKEPSHPLCSNQNCYFVGTKIPTSIPKEILVCPICGTIFE